MEDNIQSNQLEKLKSRIKYDSRKFNSNEDYENKLISLLEDSKNIALSELYPFADDFEKIELPKKYYNWQIRASCEIYKWEENQGIKSYSELGLSWSRINDGCIPQTMLDELIPRVGVPKKEVEDDNK